MKLSLLLCFGIGAASLAPSTMPLAVAAPNRVPPVAAQRAIQNDVLTWYARLPARYFAAFGDADRRELLQQKGVIYDATKGFLEIPMPGDPDKNDVQKLQIKLYNTQQGIMAAVSVVVWNQPRVPGELAFYGLAANGQMVDVTSQFFPDALQPVQEKGETVAYESAYLSHNGTTITVGVPETDGMVDYVWRNNRFEKRDATPPR